MVPTTAFFGGNQIVAMLQIKGATFVLRESRGTDVEKEK